MSVSEVFTPPHLDSICLKNDTNIIKNNKYMSPTRPYHLEFNSEPPRINVANFCKLTWNALMLPPLATNVIDSLQHHLNNRDSWNTSIPIRKDTHPTRHYRVLAPSLTSYW
eukprot:GHVR01058164.1.p1 GENE.GHVR01058164.1~~GHVR01058164.1.p1  ORF type:complete len:111 (+),score=4.02 GHVR01058164.1:545-877(+)